MHLHGHDTANIISYHIILCTLLKLLIKTYVYEYNGYIAIKDPSDPI